MNIDNANYAKLKEAMARATKWANSMSEREDTLKRPRSTMKIQVTSSIDDIPRLPTGHPGLDIITHGGIPYGRYAVLYGGPSQGKSVQAARIMISAQQAGIVPMYLAAEGTDLQWLSAQGVDLNYLILNKDETDCARILNTVDEACRGTKDPGKVDLGNPYTKLIIVDSVAAMKHVEEELKGVGGDNMAFTARRLSQYFRNHSQAVITNNVIVLFINQIRSVMNSDLEQYPGGNALKHYSSLDMHIRRVSKSDFVESIHKFMFEDSVGRTGFGNGIFIRKTKLYGVPENTRVTGVIQENVGLSKELTLAQFCVEHDILERSGASCKMKTWDGLEEKEFKTSGGFGGFADWIYENYDLAFASAKHAYETKFEQTMTERKKRLRVAVKEENTEQPVATESAKEEVVEDKEEKPAKRGRKAKGKGKK